MRYALVTGATGGIGQSICSVLTAKGFAVIATDIREADCECATFIRCDLRCLHDDLPAATIVIGQVRRLTKGSLTLLVNNAAHQVEKNLDDLTLDDWDQTIATNLTAPFLLTKAFLPMLEKAHGSIVNVASIHANLTKARFSAYAASKGGLVSLTRALAIELGPRGVRVNAVLPAAIETPMLKAGFAKNPTNYNKLGAFHPVGRIGRPEEIAELIAYLASPAAAFISGSAIEIDGGIGGRLHDPS
ncbi:SDR family oxidoreductase [soil metagenome]